MQYPLTTAPLEAAQNPEWRSFLGFKTWSKPMRWVVALTVILLLGEALPAKRFFTNPSHYLPLHSALEFVSMAVSAMIFSLAWSLRRQLGKPHLMLLGCGFLAVSLVDFAHTLSYAGMPMWITPSGAEKAINFWLAGRLIAALVLLGVAFQSPKPWSSTLYWSAVLAAISLSVLIWWFGLLHANQLPHTFIPGQGLTAFKVACEYGLMGLYALAAVLLYQKGRRSHDTDLLWLAAAAWVQGLAEMFLTLYLDVTDLFNLLGHVYKMVAYLMVYQAVFVSGVRVPYRQMRELAQLLKETEQMGNVGGWSFNIDTGVQTWTDEVYAIHEVEPTFQPTVANGIAFYTPKSRGVIERVVQRAVEQGEPFDVELQLTTAKGHLRSVHVIGKADLAQRRVYGFFQDVTERKQMEEQVRHLALHDTLTHLPNRRMLNDRLSQTMAASQRSGRFGAVMVLDLDNFKPINDLHGHLVGDLLLLEVAQRLIHCVREVDTVARFGGDEFVVLLGELDTDLAISTTEARAIAEKIRLALAQTYVLTVTKPDQADTTVTHRCTASIGVLMFLGHGVHQDALLKWADAAMYQAKAAGRNSVLFYKVECPALNKLSN